VLPIAVVVRLDRKVDMTAEEGTVVEVGLLLVRNMVVDCCMEDTVTCLGVMSLRSKVCKSYQEASRRAVYCGGDVGDQADGLRCKLAG